MTATASPSWNLSRAVRATIVCRDLKVNARTATRAVIEEVAKNMLANGHAYLEGYDVRTVRVILLDKTLGTSYPADAPAKYAGK